MPRRLLVLRHAKSSWADEYSDDWERPLTDRGMRDATRVGRSLRRLDLLPDIIITSDAVRAQTTAQIVADAAGYDGKLVLSSSLYHARPEAAIDVVRTMAGPDARTVMIVGHNPGLEDLITKLAGDHVDLATATLVRLDVQVERWNELDSSTSVDLIDMWRPDDL